MNMVVSDGLPLVLAHAIAETVNHDLLPLEQHQGRNGVKHVNNPYEYPIPGCPAFDELWQLLHREYRGVRIGFW